MFKHLTTTAYLQNTEESITDLVITNMPENYVMYSQQGKTSTSQLQTIDMFVYGVTDSTSTITTVISPERADFIEKFKQII